MFPDRFLAERAEVAEAERLLSGADQAQEARPWRTRDVARRDELMVRHPAACADHAV